MSKKLQKRLEDEFIPPVMKSEVLKLVEDGSCELRKVKATVCEFYQTSLDYILEWADYYDEFVDLYWLDLQEIIPPWNIIEY